ncbi:C-type lectin-like [Mercenaria mercenaria]|uniref:C-type lectin-like n=1 Tax=Mercenaria mercenaria TaxID=6596 RepID=UPI00234E908F|nr:C-type lectin-like [Mercenaria mercenaria]
MADEQSEDNKWFLLQSESGLIQMYATCILMPRVYKRAICPSSYYSSNGRCYRYFSTKRSWGDARAQCRSMYSGDLLSVTSSLKYNVWYHTEQTEDGELLVGANSGYTWLDGTGIPWSWYLEGEPNSDNENCVEVG